MQLLQCKCNTLLNRPGRKLSGGGGGGGGEGWRRIRVSKMSTVMAKMLRKIGTKWSHLFWYVVAMNETPAMQN